MVRDTDDLKRKMRLYHQRMTSIIEAQLASIHSEDWQDTLESTSSHITNPEEKLQEIVDMQLSDTSLSGNVTQQEVTDTENIEKIQVLRLLKHLSQNQQWKNHKL